MRIPMSVPYEKTPELAEAAWQEFRLSRYVPYYKENVLYRMSFAGDCIYPYEYTGWRDEQLSWKKTAYISAGLSGAPSARCSGPDARKFLSRYCVNTFESFPVGTGKHYITCNERGNVTSDGVMLRIGEQEYTIHLSVVLAMALQADPEKYDLVFEDISSKYSFLQVGGPRSLEILEAATGDDLHDIKFFHFRNSSLCGKEVQVIRVGMAGSLAYELHGDVEYAQEAYDAIYQAGKPFGIRRLGWHAYMMNHTEDGFPQSGYHFDYDLPNFPMIAKTNLGSTGPEFQRFYNPIELGLARTVKFDHEFVGREALEKIAAKPMRTMVTLEWNKEDILDVYASQFEDGEPYRNFDEPNDIMVSGAEGLVITQDRVIDRAGNDIGHSMGRMYSVYYRRMISLSVLDVGFAREGTEVSVVWGAPGARQKKIRAEVARFPYYNEHRNQKFDVEQIPHPRREKPTGEEVARVTIDGTYKIVVEAGGGKQEGSLTYRTKGNVLAGSVTAMGSTVDIADGKVTGDRFEHSMMAKTPLGELKMKVKGKVEGDTISGVFKAMMMSMPFSGKRI
jgi:glycine cleavage system aminomethyltransferase T